jgi:vitamin B12 transporter
VAYRNRLRDLISFSSPGPCASSFGCYANTARAEYEGLTLSAGHRLGGFNLSGSLDLQNPRDLDTGKQLARRARRHATLAVDTRLGDWTVGAEAQFSAKRYDNAANTQVLGGYGLLNLYATREWSVLARVDNLGDKDYQLARTYATGGRMVYLGLKWAPQ